MSTNIASSSSTTPPLASPGIEYQSTAVPASSAPDFAAVLGTASNVAASAATGNVAGAIASLAGGIATVAAGGSTTIDGSISQFRSENEALLRRQLEINMISNSFQGVSNVIKTDHDTRMNSIRNIRA
jgi:hypothetical protein